MSTKKIKNLAGAAGRTIKRVFKGERIKVEQEVADERWSICTSCEHLKQGEDKTKGSCRLCGCNMQNKVWWASEWCPEQKWGINDMVSVCIPYKDEPFLEKTIESIKENAIGPIEIITKEDVNSEGMRVLNNKMALSAKGKYLFFLDAHCTMSHGWDKSLKDSCDFGNLVFCRITNIDVKTWTLEKTSYVKVYMNNKLQEKWSKDISIEPLEESMCFTGCGFMMQVDTFKKLGTFDEELGPFWGIGPEWSLKIWLSGGKVQINNEVICGHAFRYKGNLEEKNWTDDTTAYAKLSNLAYNGSLPHQIHDLAWLVGKFDPVPTWDKTFIPRATGSERVEWISVNYT